MLPSTSPDPSTLAFEMAARLEHYENQLDDLVLSGFDPGVCRVATRQLEEIAMAAVALPQVRTSVIELSLQHLDLLRALEGAMPDDYPPSLHAAQVESIRAIRERCVALLVRH